MHASYRSDAILNWTAPTCSLKHHIALGAQAGTQIGVEAESTPVLNKERVFFLLVK